MTAQEALQAPPEIQTAVSQIKGSAEQHGFSNGSPAKVLEYLERTTRAFQAKTKGDPQAENPDGLKKSLQQFGKVDYDKLQEFAKGYKQPQFKDLVTPTANPQTEKLAEYALATRAVPVAERYQLDPNTIGGMKDEMVGGERRITFNDIPGYAFAPDKLVAGCITSKDRASFFYPHYDHQGNLVSSSEFTMHPYQFYMVEKMAREILAQQGKLKRLYPVKTVNTREYGNMTLEQRADSSVHVTHIASGTETINAADGLLGFPLDQVHDLDILLSSDPHYYAMYDHGTRAMLVGEQFLSHVAHPDRFPSPDVNVLSIAEITARHELNHAFWDQMSPQEAKEIISYFNPAEPAFQKFVSLFVEDAGYRNAAIKDATDYPSKEAMTVQYQGKPIKVAKERIVNELIAYATWTEIVNQQTMDKINRLGPDGKPKNPKMPAAAEAVAHLSTSQKEMLKKKLLSMERGSQSFQTFYEPFLVGAQILAARKERRNTAKTP